MIDSLFKYRLPQDNPTPNPHRSKLDVLLFIFCSQELLLNSSSTYDKYDSYSTSSFKSVEMNQTVNKINGIGFVGYAAIPLTTNLRMSKNLTARRHFSASASLAPGVLYSNNKFTSAQSSFILNASLGLRYNW